MPALIEARRLAGVDLGKHVHITDETGITWHEGTLISVKHYDESVDLMIREVENGETGPLNMVLLSPTDTLAITGRPS